MKAHRSRPASRTASWRVSSVVALVAAVLLIGGALLFVVRGDAGTESVAATADNVSMVDGKQIIDLRARGGYSPLKSVAKAGIPTILRVSTRGTFDCSSAIRIPSMGISKNLPQTGSTDIDLGSPQSGTLQGICGMGMYPFEIFFSG